MPAKPNLPSGCAQIQRDAPTESRGALARPEAGCQKIDTLVSFLFRQVGRSRNNHLKNLVKFGS